MKTTNMHRHGPVPAKAREIKHKGGKSFTFHYDGDVTITIDLDKLVAHMAHKALTATNHTTRLGQGAIVARANNVRMEMHDLAGAK